MFYDKKPDYYSMTSVLLDLPYLPSVLWFGNFLKHETVWIEHEENFVKSSHRNRCDIAGAGGKLTLSIPLQGGRDHHQKYRETKISYQSNWQSSHWQSIKSCYGSAPYFEFYCEKFEQFYEKHYDFLFDFNLDLLDASINALKLKKGFYLTTNYEKLPADNLDLRTGRVKQATIQLPRYYQVFEDKNGFIPNLSILDVIFNLGPGAKEYLIRISECGMRN